MSLLPYDQDWLDAEAVVGERIVLHGSIDDFRKQYIRMVDILTPHAPPPPPDLVDVRNFKIPSGPPVRIYRPRDAVGPLPVGIYMHGGGWAMCDLDSEDILCKVLSMSVPTVLVSVDYRLAPEHVYPAAIEDCETAFKWVLKHGMSIGADTSKMYTIGGSAGGNLAIALALKTLDWEGPTVNKGVVGIVPVTIDPAAAPKEIKSRLDQSQNADSAILTSEAMETFRKAYAPPSSSDPYFSVLLHTKIASLPPTYLVGCGKDPLSQDARLFHEALLKAGVSSKLDFYEGFPHYFWAYPVKKTQQWMGELIGGVQWVISSME